MTAALAGLAVIALGCVTELALCVRACIATRKRLGGFDVR